MNRVLGKALGAVLGFAFAAAMPAGAQAVSLIDQGETTFDPDTGLVWLDVNRTASLNHDSVSALLGAAQPLDGYRYATIAEVHTLFVNAGVGEFGPHGADGAIEHLVGLLGPTYLPGPGFSGLAGMTADEDPLNASSVYYMTLISGSDAFNDSFADVGGTLPKSAFLPEDSYGSFLVRFAGAPRVARIAELAETPLPAALPLFAGALGLLAYLARRRTTRRQAERAAAPSLLCD